MSVQLTQVLKNKVKKMCKLIVYNKRWWIKRGDKIVLRGIGTSSQALAIARANDVVLTEFKDINKRAA